MKKITAKKILMKYLENKNFLIYHLTGLEIFDKRDFNEARRWTKEKCETFLETISCYNDMTLCPWCFFHYNKDLSECVACKYDKRHGNCIYDAGSQYQYIIYKLGSIHFSEMDDFNYLMKEVEKTWENLRDRGEL